MPVGETHFSWQWPNVGPTPVSYGLDAEIFDTEQFPNAQTFVREAIQNSLDARVESSQPVCVRFAFHEAELGQHARFLGDLRNKKERGGLTWPAKWDQGRISWLTVQDFNASGLTGDVSSRTSDFWNYWLNFGVSNKSGAGRGGRGIGRVTFLIASQISTVIGLTQRHSDRAVLSCGMSVLKPVEDAGELRTSYAYLAKASLRNTFELYENSEFHSALAEAFDIPQHLQNNCPGLSLVIPYPHDDLSADKLIAAAIENFAPAIINGNLVVEVDSVRVDCSRIDAEAGRIRNLFASPGMKEDPSRLLGLIRAASGEPDCTIQIDKSVRLSRQTDDETRTLLRNLADSDQISVLKLDVAVVRHRTKSYSPILISFARAQQGKKPIDLFYREGMALPQVVASNAADIDLVVQSNEGELATYLNFCEGKAHLDLLENRDVKDKLAEKGFEGVGVKRFVRWLMDDVRAIVLPDASKPDSTVMRGFFSVVRKDPKNSVTGQGGSEQGDPNRPRVKPDEAPPPPKPKPFEVREVEGGFRIYANADYAPFPAGFRAEVAYATGERRPRWSRHDFELQNMNVSGDLSRTRVHGNIIEADNCLSGYLVEVVGFDKKRELTVNIVSGGPEDA